MNKDFHIAPTEGNALLKAAVEDLMEHSAHLGLRRVSVTVENDQIILTGTVPSYYLKQMAQETVRQACPNRRVSNTLAVIDQV